MNLTAALTAMANHLWQSTLFLLAAALLALILRKNQARVRHGVWLAASLKFFLPFSLLIVLGGHLAKPHLIASTPTGMFSTVQEVSQPFAHGAHSSSAIGNSVVWIGLFGKVLTMVWIFGCIAVLARWWQQWKRISRILADAQALDQGLEVDALRAAERIAGVRKPTALMVSRNSLEPGIFGILRPVLLWPEAISSRLQSEHLEAIVAHEVCHVRRRDNLAAAFHMLVEAIFWFHPLVWWLGARLVEERERACDEHVLLLGNSPRTYAESILKTCEFCVESPLACVAGVAGSDLRSRIVRIMTGPGTTPLGSGKKLLLAFATVLAMALPATFGVIYEPRTQAATIVDDTPGKLPAYEVVSIKANKSGTQMVRMMTTPDGFNGSNVPMRNLIQDAYGLEDNRLLGAPAWLGSEGYDIEAKVESADSAALRDLTPSQRGVMLQPVLRERLQLKVHWETKPLTVYALVVDKSGSKLHEAKPGDSYPNGLKGPDDHAGGPGMMMVQYGHLTSQAVGVSDLTSMLSQQLGTTVVDKTGLTGKYDITLQWQQEQSSAPPGADAAEQAASAPLDAAGPSIFSALQDQLGLKLEAQKNPVQVLVIDHVERPSAN